MRENVVHKIILTLLVSIRYKKNLKRELLSAHGRYSIFTIFIYICARINNIFKTPLGLSFVIVEFRELFLFMDRAVA